MFLDMSLDLFDLFQTECAILCTSFGTFRTWSRIH
jgi:hypothetical protein